MSHAVDEQQSDFYDPIVNTATPSSSRRAAEHASQLNSPQAPPSSGTPRASAAGTRVSCGGAMATSTYHQFYPDPDTPASLPIRTSAQQTPTQGATAGSFDSHAYTSRASAGHGSDSERDRAPDSDRRRNQRSPREEQPNSGRSQRTRNAPTSSRSTTAIGQPPMGTDLPRENSTVIQRIVVDDPHADIAREELRQAESRPHGSGAHVTPMQGLSLVPDQGVPDAVPAQRSRQEHLKHSNSNRKEVKFGEYILGQTLGEGEFGKVKMGWKKDSTVQVAIKLIRKESLAGNATRLPKIYREIAILRELQHPNIVRLHEFVETERHMGIILEYASGGELFDYILNQRYLKDPAARRLFAQLVSGVGYLHQKGIVHRDLKLENLLLDRNKHIIITDFGFANTFDSNDELGEAIESRISDKDFIKQQGLDKVTPWRDSREGGHRRGDLMQTSCGSPCYAAPELVVSDGLYTGRKVDVWSCGVILYAMLAGYLPFDDDPANPEGDNINLLYKYIVNTPLTFPDYVTPHARDLLRRILVPDPRRRADLFEVARHSWLSEYTHVLGFIGSKLKNEQDVGARVDQNGEDMLLDRSASVREPSTKIAAVEKTSANRSRHVGVASIGGDETSDMRNKQQRDTKRRTIQVEYQAPKTDTVRGEVSPTGPVSQSTPYASRTSNAGKTRARAEGGPVESSSAQQASKQQDAMPPPLAKPVREHQRSDSTGTFGKAGPPSASRPNTGGTLSGASRLPSRGNSYGQPSAAQSIATTAQGSISMPKSTSGYMISSPIPSEHGSLSQAGRPMSQYRNDSIPQAQPAGRPSGHRRTSTWGSLTDKILSRSNSRRSSHQQDASSPAPNEKRDRRYPPVSMRNAMPHAAEESPAPRPSTDGRRPSFGFGRKASRERQPSVKSKRSSRRFSFLPASLSISNLTGRNKEQGYDSGVDDGSRQRDSSQAPTRRPDSKGMAFGRGSSRSPSGSTQNSAIPPLYDADRQAQRRSQLPPAKYDKALPPQPNEAALVGSPPAGQAAYGSPAPVQRKQFRDDGYGNNRLEHPPTHESVERYYTPGPEQQPQQATNAPPAQQDEYGQGQGQGQPYSQSQPQMYDHDGPPGLRPQQRRFGGEGYETGNAGSSSATRRVMDFFRRRGKERGEA